MSSIIELDMRELGNCINAAAVVTKADLG